MLIKKGDIVGAGNHSASDQREEDGVSVTCERTKEKGEAAAHELRLLRPLLA